MKQFLLILTLFSSSFCSMKSIVDYSKSVGKYFIVSNPIIVGSGDTLIVPQGREVLFTNFSGITISSGGTLSAIGTKEQPIFFTSLLDTSGSASAFDWNGIDIKKGAFAHFSYCLIAFSTSGITSEDSSGVLLENCIFSVNGQWNLSVSGIITKVPDNQPFSFCPQPSKLIVSSVLPLKKDSLVIQPEISKSSNIRTRNFILGGLCLAFASAGIASFYKAHSYHSKYNAFVPGNPSYDALSPAARQDHFDKLRKKYYTFSSIGYSCLGLAAVDGFFFCLSIKF